MIKMYFDLQLGTQMPIKYDDEIKGINWREISNALFPVYTLERRYLGYVVCGNFVSMGQIEEK
jgi:hypothetical protein